MFALGHLGLGKKLATRPYRRFSRAEKVAFFLGALLPDLIDNPLFYLPYWLTGGRSADGILSGTRLWSHTLLFLLALVVAAMVTRARPMRALAIGVVTHIALDCASLTMTWTTLLWPLLGWRFPPYPFRGLGEHLATILSPITLVGEVLGAAVLLWDWRKARGAATRPN